MAGHANWATLMTPSAKIYTQELLDWTTYPLINKVDDFSVLGAVQGQRDVGDPANHIKW
jgi:hypothetical protein